MAKLTGNLIPVPCPAASGMSGMNGIITTKESISEQLSDVKWAIYRRGGGGREFLPGHISCIFHKEDGHIYFSMFIIFISISFVK